MMSDLSGPQRQPTLTDLKKKKVIITLSCISGFITLFEHSSSLYLKRHYQNKLNTWYKW